MEFTPRKDISWVSLPGRSIQRIVGRDAPMASDRMTVGFARYSDESGPMQAHRHAEETVVVLDARDAQVRYGANPEDLSQAIPLEPGLVLHFAELEWHVFTWGNRGYADCLVIYGQVDNIRPEEK